ncbi:MAG: hypothetical protein HC804_14955 [Anaerolineae bacterium]|nr:hypothetical protein [Anaerolineae bacterium]
MIFIHGGQRQLVSSPQLLKGECIVGGGRPSNGDGRQTARAVKRLGPSNG